MIATIIVTITNMHGMIVLIGTSTATDLEAFSVTHHFGSHRVLD